VRARTDDAARWLAEREQAMREDLRALVEQSSFSEDPDGVRAALDALEHALPPAWRRERVRGSERFGDHLVVRGARPASDGGVLLVGHIDTVFAPDVFAGYREEGERARGPGVLDMKGGLVVSAYGLRAAQECGALDALPWSWVIVGDEELGSPDSAETLRREARGARCALVFESGRAHDAIITRRKGTGTVEVTARGVAAHAGNAHDKGKNALWALARFIDRAQSLTDYARGVTVNVGTARGGTSKNTVPDRAVASVDVRFVRAEDRDALRVELERVARECPVDGTQVELTWGPGRAPLEKTPASAALRDAYARCQRESGLGDGESPLVGGGSDASTTSAEGVPSIDALGVRGEGFHTLHEYAELRTLAPKAEALARFLALAPSMYGIERAP
jgi:glutamate carboxypeptidase